MRLLAILCALLVVLSPAYAVEPTSEGTGEATGIVVDTSAMQNAPSGTGGLPANKSDAQSVFEFLEARPIEDQVTECTAGQGPVSDGAGNLICAAVGGGSLADGDKGDVTVSGSGANWQLDADSVGGTEVDESTLSAVPSASALAANPANCTNPGEFPRGVDAAGAAESCTDAWTQAEETAQNPRTITVCSAGCDATTICGFTCSDSSLDQKCDAGSGVELARALTPTLAAPVTIDVLPGLYPECVALNAVGAPIAVAPQDLAGLTLRIGAGATVRPAVTASTDVVDGVIRIGQTSYDGDGDPPRTTHVKVVVDGVVQNDAFGAPEAAIQIGREAASTTADLWTWDYVTIEINGKVIGHHDAVQWAGARGASTTAPHFALTGSGWSIGGRDNVVKKGASFSTIDVANIWTSTNYCESPLTSFLAQVDDAAVVSGTTATAVIQNADAPGPDDFYVHRQIEFTDGSGSDCGTANGAHGCKGVVVDWNNSSRTATFQPACETAITSGCGYTLKAVQNLGDAACRDVDWTTIGAGVSAGLWKVTGVHLGTASTANVITPDKTVIRNSKIVVDLNDASVASVTCGAGNGGAAGIYAWSGKVNTLDVEGVDVTVNVNYDQQPLSCAYPVAALKVEGTATVQTLNWRSGSGTVNNPGLTGVGDPDIPTWAVALDGGSNAQTLYLGNVLLDVTNTVGSYTGATGIFRVASPHLMAVTGIPTSPDTLTFASGSVAQVSGWREHCVHVPTGAGTVFTARPINLSDSLAPIVVHSAAGRCLGVCGASETVTIKDAAGDTIGTVALVDNSTALSYTDLSADADADDFAAGQSPQIDDGTLSGTAGDDLFVCVRATGSKW